jgi:hypothetical protein
MPFKDAFLSYMIVSDPRDRGEKNHAADKEWYCITLKKIRLASIRF